MFYEWNTILNATMSLGRTVLFNACGVLGIVMQILIYQMKTRKKILCLSMINNVIWFSYFALQGDFLSGVTSVVGFVSGCIFLFRGKYRFADSKAWLILFVAIAVGMSVFTFNTWKDIFPCIGCAASISALFMIKEENIRKISLVTYAMFMCNSISKLYVVALVADVTAFASVVIGLIRYKKKDNILGCKEKDRT